MMPDINFVPYFKSGRTERERGREDEKVSKFFEGGGN